MTTALKPCPPDFAEVFIRHGWRGIESAFGARREVEKRWLGECGHDELKQARRAYRVRLAAMRATKC
jgi:hypothetical protein